jgi:molecular chaperone GrpE
MNAGTGYDDLYSDPVGDITQANEERIATMAVELASMRDRWMRAEAEIANVRTRAKRDVDEARQYAVQKFASDIAEATENLRRGLNSIPPVMGSDPAIIAQLRDGFAGVERNFMTVLERNGVKSVDPTGTSFDPAFQQAVAEQVTSDHPPGTVIQAMTSTWLLNGRLLRPAMVIVAKPPPPQRAEPSVRPAHA